MGIVYKRMLFVDSDLSWKKWNYKILVTKVGMHIIYIYIYHGIFVGLIHRHAVNNCALAPGHNQVAAKILRSNDAIVPDKFLSDSII